MTEGQTNKRKESEAAFCPFPLYAIEDQRLTLLELRVLGVISYHDRLSIPRGKGQGAWVAQQKIAERLGAHFTSVSSAIARLAKLGYLTGERHPLNKRLRVYRVIYQTAAGDTLSAQGKDAPASLSHAGKDGDQTLSQGFENDAQNQEDASVEYISQSDVRYSAKAEKDIPLRGASPISAKSVGLNLGAHRRDTPKGGLSGGVSLNPHLGENFFKLPVDAMLCRFDQAFAQIGRDAELIEGGERDQWANWLSNVAVEHDGAGHHQAMRLFEEVARY